MSATPRQSRPPKKAPPEPARCAWTGARASPTFSPPPTSSPRTQATSPSVVPFPSLSQTNGARSDSQDRILQSLSGLTGTTVTLHTKTAQRYEGVVASTSGEGDTTGVTLKDVKEITNAGAPLKDQLFIASTNIDSWSSGPADAKLSNGDTFRTDTDISQKKGAARERELQQWQPGADGPNASGGGQPEDDTFGPGTNRTHWDQFAANEKLFGVKTQFDENVYTTKLDRSGADFKEREREAQRIANEIIGAGTSNPHIAEERNVNNVDDSGVNEEDKYGAVVRGTNAYVPPGARKPGVVSPPVNNVAKTELPKVSVNGPDGTAIPSQTHSPPSSKGTSPAPPNKPPADPLPAFRDFVTNEKQRLTEKRQALVKSEMDKRMAELVKFSRSFKLNKPIPDDLVPILAKDEDKQRAIRDKASKDAASAQARSISAATAASASRGTQIPPSKMNADVNRRPLAPAKTSANNVGASTTTQKVAASTKPTNSSDPAVKTAPSKPNTSTMFIQAIPPFKGKSRQPSGGSSAMPANGSATANTPAAPASGSNSSANAAAAAATANRLNVNASSFRPNPKANAFTPGASSPISAPSNSNQGLGSVSPKSKPDSAPNLFFGTRPIKKSTPVNVKDDFNPFKHNKVVDASQVSALWPYTGKRYIQMFPPPQHQPQHPSHMPPPGPPPIPPPSYEEDSAAQAAARGYVYAYPPYGYPGQPMMPGMAPPGPPGTYMPGPYMQPMQYPPGMPPPAMYSPGMGQMPPYMPPPPGPYPPPNGAGPRPSMPPTPIPAHAHPYYHQSPQLQHAVPYHMMMPPPPNVPQHPYEGGPAPPVQMGGHA